MMMTMTPLLNYLIMDITNQIRSNEMFVLEGKRGYPERTMHSSHVCGRLTLSPMQQPYSLKPGFCMICNGPQPSKADCVGLIADDHKHRRQIIPFKFEAIADKRTTNPLRREENKERTSSLIGGVTRGTIVCRRQDRDTRFH